MTQSKMGTKKNRGKSCRKKVGLLGLPCRCKGVFCEKCLDPDKHECTFDFAARHQEILEKKNPKIVASKVEKIGGEHCL